MNELMRNFESITQSESLPLSVLENYDFIATFGVYQSKSKVKNQFKSQVCLHPFLDTDTHSYMRYEVGAEEGIGALFLHALYAGQDRAVLAYINDLDFGYLTSETNLSEEEVDCLKMLVGQSKKPLLLIGSDVYLHDKASNIINMLHCLDIDIMVLSPNANHLHHLNKSDILPKPICGIPENNGCIVYLDYGVESYFRISKEFARAWKLDDGVAVELSFDGVSVERTCQLDDKFSGIIGLLGMKDFYGYPYKQATIEKRR